MKGSRVVYCDSRNNKLLWKAALKHACAEPEATGGFWRLARLFLLELFS